MCVCVCKCILKDDSDYIPDINAGVCVCVESALVFAFQCLLACACMFSAVVYVNTSPL